MGILIFLAWMKQTKAKWDFSNSVSPLWIDRGKETVTVKALYTPLKKLSEQFFKSLCVHGIHFLMLFSRAHDTALCVYSQATTQLSVCIPRLDPSLCLLSCRCASSRSAALLGHLFSLWLTFHNKSDLPELLNLVNSDKLTAMDTFHLKVKVSVGEGTKTPSHPNWV